MQRTDSEQAASLRADCVKILKRAPLPRHNVSRGEREALKRLKDERDIMILPADKGRAVVVMNSKGYTSKAKELLSDTTTYKPLKKDPTSKYSTQVIKKLQELKNSHEISETEYRKMYPTGCIVPRFYGLPKIHKKTVPLRPIVASRGSVTYQVARHLAHILSPLVTRNPHILKNSAELVKLMSPIQLEEDDVMVSFDVTALFPSVPVDRSLEVVQDLLEKDNTLTDRTNISISHIIELLESCLRLTYFIYDGQIYSQVEGTAMGSPVSPIVANILIIIIYSFV